MSKEDILTYFYTTSGSLTPGRIILLLLLALAGSLGIYFVYSLTSQKDTYSRSYNQGNIILALLTSVIMMMISSNIVISLGMVGALSIVRFRTAVKNARDTLFFFWAIVLGLSVGSQHIMLAAISTIFIAVVILLLGLFPIRKGRYTIVIRCEAGKETEMILSKVLSIFDEKRVTGKILSSNTAHTEAEYVFSAAGDEENCLAVIEQLRVIEGIVRVNLICNEL